MLLHFIWVGNKEIPISFLENLKKVKEYNPESTIMEWNDESLIHLIKKYSLYELYTNSSIFHKLQLARYLVLNEYGGLYTDYDVFWKVPISEFISSFHNKELLLIQRNSIYFYKKVDKVLKINLLDDYVIYSNPNITYDFIKYSLNRGNQPERLKNDITEPFSVYSLTEWVYDSNYNIGYITHNQIYDNEFATIAYHMNKKTWNE